MGISGLLPALKSIQTPRHIKHWSGKTVAVDAYGWLHRGTVSCAVELALGRPTKKYVEFAMGRIRMLLHFGITPYVVFDGDYLPSKAGEESGRAAKREASRKVGLELLKQGKTGQAHLELQKAVDVTPQMARYFIDELKEAGIAYIVAPYEADAQMYYLEHIGVADAILSEDSDLLVFGCKNLITKLSQFGECLHICRDDFARCKELSLAGWTDADFRCMAILSGCDYLENIPRMGLKTAYRLVRKHRDIEKILRIVRFDGQYSVPTGYLDRFRQADLTFQHQRVYCPISKRMVMCTDPKVPLNDEDLIFIGPEIDESLAQGVALGELDPMTKQPLLGASSAGKGSARKAGANPGPNPKLQPRTPAKQGKSILNFFQPRAPLQEQQQNRVSTQKATVQSKSLELLKRSSSLVNEDEKVQKKAKLPAEGSSTISSNTEEEQCSKYFQTPKNRRGRRDLTRSIVGQDLKPTGKENVELKTVIGLIDDIDATISNQPGFSGSGAIDGEEKDSIQIVAQGWRERYAFNPQGNSARLTTLMKQHNNSPTAKPLTPRMPTPLQRIGANALGGSRVQKLNGLVRPAKEVTQSALSVSERKTARQTTVIGGTNDFALHKYLYTPS